MMKMVPASRRVTEASLEPPSSARRRAMAPAGEAVADCVSITATRVHPRNAPRGGGDNWMYQPFVKIGLGGRGLSFLRTQEPITTGRSCAKRRYLPGRLTISAAAYGSRLALRL